MPSNAPNATANEISPNTATPPSTPSRPSPTSTKDAGTLKVYEPQVIYGLLQTEEYASTLLFGDREAIDARMARQAILTRTNPAPPRLVYLLPEIALWYDVGGSHVMQAQLQRLAEAVGPRLSVQIIPNGATHPGNQGTFTLASTQSGEEIAYVETAARGIMMDRREDMSKLKDKFDAMWTQALPVSLSVDLIYRTIEEKWKT